jgi:CheY-like chemotaxis protein
MLEEITMPPRRDEDGLKALFKSAKYRTRQRPHILVVDDDRDTRQMYSELLRSFGYLVDTVENGESGWRAVHIATRDAFHYDLVITDDEMPKMTGVELVKKLSREYVSLPVIMTATALPANASKLRLSTVLQKPFFPGELVQAVKDVLEDAGNDWVAV